MARSARGHRSRWNSFIAGDGDPPRGLREDGNPSHRLRVEHDATTLLIHLSGEEGVGWTVFAVDRATRTWAAAQDRRQFDAARSAYEELRSGLQPGQRGG
jgi:hypothetical protein